MKRSLLPCVFVLVLAACGQGETPAPADAVPAAPAPVAADPGRGAMLSARADRIEQGVLQAVAEQRLTPAEGQAAQDRIAAARQTLSGMLAQTPGPLSPENRTLIAQALDAVEAEVAD